MEIETLKRAAEFMGRIDTKKLEEIQSYKEKGGAGFWIALMAEKAIWDKAMYKFNPHEDANLLKKMELKLSHQQWNKYKGLMMDVYDDDLNPNGLLFAFERWFKCEAKTELCFNTIMEVIPKHKVNGEGGK